MPINPNIIMQAGRPSVPLKQRDPMRDAMSVLQVKSSVQRNNALKEQNERAAQKRDAEEGYKRLSMATPENYAQYRNSEIAREPEAAQYLPEQWDEERIEQLKQTIGTSLLDASDRVRLGIAENTAKAAQARHDEKMDFGRKKLGYVPTAEQIAAKKEIARAGASRNTTINKQEGEEAKTVGKFFGETYASAQKGEAAARSMLSRMERLDELMNGIETGTFATTKIELQKALTSMGFDPGKFGLTDNMGAAEAGRALANQMALELRSPASGAGMPGAMSDKDREFLIEMIPSLSTTAEGRKKIIATYRKVAQRAKEVARMARKWRSEHGSLSKVVDGEGFFDHLAGWSEANELFGAERASAGVVVEMPTDAAEAEAAYQKMSSGTRFKDPDGNYRTKP